MAQGQKGTGLSGKYQGKPCIKGHDGLRYRNGGACVDCVRAVNKKKWRDDPVFRQRKIIAGRKPETKRLLRDRVLMKRYGLTREAHDTMLFEQGHACAICGAGRGKQDFHVDHDHDTTIVRGLLCTKCNVGLGSFSDSPDKLRLAIAYLHKHGRQ